MREIALYLRSRSSAHIELSTDCCKKLLNHPLFKMTFGIRN